MGYKLPPLYFVGALKGKGLNQNLDDQWLYQTGEA
jgi:hypothetical protein